RDRRCAGSLWSTRPAARPRRRSPSAREPPDNQGASIQSLGNGIFFAKARFERAPWVTSALWRGAARRERGAGRLRPLLMAQFVVCFREPPAQLHCPQKSCRRVGTKAPLSYSRHKARDRTVGPGEVRRSIVMRRLPVASLDPMKFLQAFAAGLRAEFADAA